MNKLAIIFGVILITGGISSVVYSKLPEIHQEFQNTNVQAYVSFQSAQDKMMFTLTEGEANYIVELTAPTRIATQQQIDVQANIQSIGATVTGSFTTTVNAMTVKADSSQITKIASLPQVKRIYKDSLLKTTIMDDTLGSDVAYTYSAYNSKYTGNGIMVFVIDTGIDSHHPAFQRDGNSMVKVSYSIFDKEYTYWHGTMAASIIASVAPGVDLGSVCVFNDRGEAFLSDILRGLDYVARWHATHNEFTIASCSWGIEWECGKTPCIICESVSNLADQGVPVIAAAGNSGENGIKSINCPAQSRGALAVGAVDSNLQVAYFSSIGPAQDGRRKPDVVAVGVNVVGAQPGEGTTVASGTSFSCPAVAGAVACLAEKYGNDYTAYQYYQSIISGAVDLGQKGWDPYYGWGYVNVNHSFSVMSSLTPRQTYYTMGVSMIMVGGVVAFSPFFRRKKYV